MKENKNNGIKTVITVIIALIMTTTIFVPVISNIAGAENTGNVNETNDNNESNTPTVTEDNPEDAPLLPGMEGYQEELPPVPELPEEPNLTEPDIPEEYGIIGTEEEENAPTVYIDSPDYSVINGNIVNNTTVSEAESNPDIVLNDIGAYPLEMPNLVDTHLSWRDLRHWRDLFPKFMALEDKDNVVYVELKNVGNESYIVKLDLYEINPDGNKTLLGTEHYGMLRPNKEKTRMEFWVPEMGGRNYIYGEIYIMEVNGGFCHPNVNWTLINTFKKSFNVVPSDRPVRIITGDWVVDTPTVIESETVIVNGDMYVNAPLEIKNTTVLGDNLTVTAPYTIDAGSDMDIASWNESGEYSVTVKSTGTLEVYGKLWNNPNDIYYNFYVYGNLTVDKDPYAEEAGSISEVNGNISDLSQPGGIIARDAVGRIKILNGGTIYNCRGHALWLDDSEALIRDGVIRDNGGDGIVAVNGAVVDVEGANVSWNGRYGINVDGGILETGKYNGKNNTISWNGMDGIHVENVVDAYGRPDFVGGVDLGYFIWYDSDGWHMVYSADSSSHQFNGTLILDGTKTEFSDTLLGGQYTEKYLGTYTRIVFDIWIDGERQTSLVFIGSQGLNPPYIPFMLSSNAGIRNSVIESNMGSGIYAKSSAIAIENNTISDNGMALKLFDDVENGTAGWNATGLWHRVYNGTKINGKWSTPAWNISHSGDWSWWYGYEHNGTGDYNTTENGTATRNYGNLVSPLIDLTGAKSAYLTFWSWHEVEPEGMGHPSINPPPGPPTILTSSEPVYDGRWVVVGDENDYKVYEIKNDPENEWTRITINISDFRGREVYIAFVFDTGDGLYNGYRGWYLDDIKAIAATPSLRIDGIHMEKETAGSYIYNNTISSNSGGGVSCVDGQNTEIIKNRIMYNNFGVLSSLSQLIDIENNTVLHNRNYGLILEASFSCKMANNTISGTQSASSYGIYMYRSPPVPAYSSEAYPEQATPAESNNTILMKLKPSQDSRLSESNVINRISKDIGVRSLRRFSHTGIFELKLNRGVSVDVAIHKLSRYPEVLYAEPDYKLYASNIPNDPHFSLQWALKNTGQKGGMPGADIGAPDAWNISTGNRDIVVAVIDTGVDYTHPDLRDNIWTNPGETGIDDNGNDRATNGIDDDHDGYVDDVHGINAITGTGDPKDDYGHGTHCAGIIGGVGNNSVGIAGINWNVSIMPLKFLSSSGSGYTSDAIKCLEYVISMKENGTNIRVTSNSWGGGGYSQALYDAIAATRDAGILFVAAAGNSNLNTDYYKTYPSCYNLTNIVSVAASDNTDKLAHFSNYGYSTVDVAAPGVDIYSTMPTYPVTMNAYGLSENYCNLTGTSMATPYVSGLAALISAKNPSYNFLNTKNLILNTAEPVSDLENKVLSGGRINAYDALSFSPTGMTSMVESPGKDSMLLLKKQIPVVVCLSDGVHPITNATVNVRFSSDEPEITLYDNGMGADQVAGDGYYSASWIPSELGNIMLEFRVNKTGYANITTTINVTVLRGNSIINNNITHNTASGLESYLSDQNIFRNNTISNNGYTGIDIAHTNKNIIDHNHISGNGGHGIQCLFSEGTIIHNNTASFNKFTGAYIFAGGSTSITGNNFSSNGVGTINSGLRLIMSMGSNTIEENTCNHNSLAGILDADSFGDRMTHNTCNYNRFLGIYFYRTDVYGFPDIINNNISHNFCQYNLYGIGFQINSISHENMVFHNNVSNNTYGIYIYIYPTPNNPEPFGGNSSLTYMNTMTADHKKNIISIKKNNITYCNDSLSVVGEEKLDILPVVVEKNTLCYSNRGMLVKNVSINISSNTIRGASTVALYLSSSLNNTISNNTIGTGYYTVKNETVYGPTSSGDTGPLYLNNNNIFNCTIYLDTGSEWVKLKEGTDYTLNYATGEIDTSGIEPFEAGWTFYAHYSYTYSTPSGNGYGIYSINSSAHIDNNTIIENEEDGVFIESHGNYSLEVSIDNNTIAGNHQGIDMFNGSAAIINNDVFSNHGAGIFLENSTAEVSLNWIMGNNAPRQWYPPYLSMTGIDMRSCNNVNINSNHIENNIIDIYSLKSENIFIENNSIVESNIILEIYPSPPPSEGIKSIDSQMSIGYNDFYGTVYAIDLKDMDRNTTLRNNSFYPFIPSPSSSSLQIPAYPIYLKNASVLVEWNNISVAEMYGIYCSSNSSARIENNTINATYDAIHSVWSSPLIRNNTISSLWGRGIYSAYRAPANAGENGTELVAENTFGNCSEGWAVQYWNLQIKVMDSGNPVENASVVIYNHLGGQPVWDGYTDENGYTGLLLLPQYAYNSTGVKTQYSPYTIIINGNMAAQTLHLESNVLLTYDTGTHETSIITY